RRMRAKKMVPQEQHYSVSKDESGTGHPARQFGPELTAEGSASAHFS
ncbi:hypothetical protein HY250_02090, partial [Candidatus Azambacteria bacterium]|nr:hypothetical protein [Candidatus Azambacteria bacterium]